MILIMESSIDLKHNEQMMNAFVSIFTWIGAGVLVIILWLGSIITVMLTGWLDPDRRITHWWSVWWAKSTVAINPLWELNVHKHAVLDPRRAYILVANHQSIADIVLLPHIEIPYKCVSKSALFDIPFFGWSLSLHRHIKLRRGSMHGIKQAMIEAENWLHRGMSVAFFVEGTRSHTGSLGVFKNGAFKLAVETQIPIVPIAMVGTRNAIPRGSWVFKHKVKGHLVVHAPIETSRYDISQVNLLKERVFSVIENTVHAYANINRQSLMSE